MRIVEHGVVLPFAYNWMLPEPSGHLLAVEHALVTATMPSAEIATPCGTKPLSSSVSVGAPVYGIV